MQHAWLAALAVVLLTLSGCQSSSSGNGSPTRVRVLHAVPDSEPLDILVDDVEKVGDIAAGNLSSYEEVNSGTRAIKVRSATQLTVVAARTATLTSGASHTLYLHGKRSAIQTLLLIDDTSNPPPQRFKMRIVGLNPDVGVMDMYVGGADISAATPVFLSVGYGTVIDFVEFDAGTLTITLTAVGTKDILFQSAPTAFSEGKKIAFVVFPSLGGKFTNAALLDSDGGSILANALSRVKAVNGVPGSTLNFRLGSAAIDNVAFAAASSYATANSGSATLRVEAANVPGTALASTTVDLQPAGDHSVLALGSLGASQILTLRDDNGLPFGATARIRFVNANLGGGPTDVLLNFVTRTPGLAPGTASAYVQVPATSAYNVTFVAPGGTAVIGTVDGTLETGGVYTAYLFGPATSPTARLVRDR